MIGEDRGDTWNTNTVTESIQIPTHNLEHFKCDQVFLVMLVQKAYGGKAKNSYK